MRRHLLLSLIVFICATSFAQAQQLGALPATFKGDLPCADCSAVQYQLDLFSDHTYDLLMIYRGKSGNGVSQSGQWEMPAPRRLALHGAGDTIQFSIESPNSLQLANPDGTPIVSSLNYSLTRDVKTADAALTSTVWRLTRLQDEPARRFPNQTEPQIVMQGERLTGSDGCNRLSGSYRQTGAALSFGLGASTQMACSNGMQQAGRFNSALAAVARYRIAGRHLELLDGADALLMRFEAVFVR
jgi:heat shock protein HslJ